MTEVCEFPYEVFGVGCPNATGGRAEQSLRGLPQQGGSFTATVRGAEPHGVCITWFGLSDVLWSGIGSLPWDAAPLGAAGCAIYASPDFTQLSLVDAAGTSAINVPVPVNPTLSDMRVYSQSACSSTAYSAGFASSDAMVIRLR